MRIDRLSHGFIASLLLIFASAMGCNSASHISTDVAEILRDHRLLVALREDDVDSALGFHELWLYTGGTCRLLSSGRGFIRSMDFSPESGFLAISTAYFTGTNTAQSPDSGLFISRPISDVSDLVSLRRFSWKRLSPVDGFSVDFAPGGSHLAYLPLDGSGQMVILDTLSGQMERRISSPLDSVSWSIDGMSLTGNHIALNRGPALRYYIASSVTTTEVVNGVVAHMAYWSPDGKSIVWAGGDSRLRITEGANTRQSVIVNGRPVRWSPDSRLFAAHTQEGVRVFEASGLRSVFVPCVSHQTAQTVMDVAWLD